MRCPARPAHGAALAGAAHARPAIAQRLQPQQTVAHRLFLLDAEGLARHVTVKRFRSQRRVPGEARDVTGLLLHVAGAPLQRQQPLTAFCQRVRRQFAQRQHVRLATVAGGDIALHPRHRPALARRRQFPPRRAHVRPHRGVNVVVAGEDDMIGHGAVVTQAQVGELHPAVATPAHHHQRQVAPLLSHYLQCQFRETPVANRLPHPLNVPEVGELLASRFQQRHAGVAGCWRRAAHAGAALVLPQRKVGDVRIAL
ncbi:MAG: hypothetical protein BWY76_00814 [bacterium ADurb.Bin429]|nr:MAG: hypothetical protein BWY76_00814 [bacterium ADurb.Bin429]